MKKCLDRSEDITSRKLWHFCIEAEIFFSRRFFVFSPKKSYDFHWKKINFFSSTFPTFFDREKKSGLDFLEALIRCRNILAFDWWCFQSDPDTSSYFLEAVSKKTKFFFTEPQNLVSFGNVLRGTALNPLRNGAILRLFETLCVIDKVGMSLLGK